MPESLEGSKTQVFGFIQDSLSNRVNGWTFKFFTNGGKEVIINHDFFRLPKAVTKKIDECGGTIVVEFKGKYKRHALEIMKQIMLS